MAVRVFVVKHSGVTHHLSSPPSSPPHCTFSHSPLLTVFSYGPDGRGERSHMVLGFSKIHASLLYLTGNYMELWHNGDQLSAAAISAGATDPKSAVQQPGCLSHLCSPLLFFTPLSPWLHLPPIAGPVLAKISCPTTEKAAVNWGQITTHNCKKDHADKRTSKHCQHNKLLPAACNIHLGGICEIYYNWTK